MCVSGESHAQGTGRQGAGREGPVPGAGVGPGGNRVRFQEILEGTSVAGRVVWRLLALLQRDKAKRRGI